MLVALTAAAPMVGCTAETGSADDNYVVESDSAPAYFDMHESEADGQYYFSLKSANHQVVLTSEGY